jgi:pimeloyl-ACP methyl ester carboxylesterase
MKGNSGSGIAWEGARWTAVGPVGGPLVVLVHPTRLNRTYWAPQVEALSETNRVVAVDLPGHGRVIDQPFTLPAAVESVRAALESEVAPRRAGPTVIVGLSLGGYVAMALAAEAPSIADALVLAGCTSEPVGTRAGLMRALAATVERADRRGLDRLSRTYLRRRYPGPTGARIVESGLAQRGAAEALRCLAGEPFLPRLAAYPGRVVLVNGQRDLVMRPGERAFLAATPNGRLVRLPGAYHLSSLERPRQFNAVVRSVVAKAAADRAGESAIRLAAADP